MKILDCPPLLTLQLELFALPESFFLLSLGPGLPLPLGGFMPDEYGLLLGMGLLERSPLSPRLLGEGRSFWAFGSEEPLFLDDLWCEERECRPSEGYWRSAVLPRDGKFMPDAWKRAR